MKPETLELLTKLLTLGLELLGGLIVAYLLPKLPAATSNFIEWGKANAAKTKSEYANGLIRRMIDLLGAKVLAAENTLIQDLKEAAADGKVTKEELAAALKKVKEQVIADAKATASAQGIWGVIQDTLFKGDSVTVDKWLGDTVEALVAKLPPSGLQTVAASNLGAPAIVLGDLVKKEVAAKLADKNVIIPPVP